MFAWAVAVVESRDANGWQWTWLRRCLAVEGCPTEQLRQLFYSGLAFLAPDGAVLGDVELLVADGDPPSA
ncbi:hypothetical protein RBWH47_04011 [Rhodopirellula baltica WH47]|uniref:Uncharacterized protein n=2 Tax=Rhodopirellula baltica TaxID=265606 RepID=F2ATY8_RHOBT|nr:hypothetical protein RBWH47_04011 [Rhodopirellula baltica WH47]ELP32079.1 hypothetical protein RBSWK_03778 [Rhodopirellula baltica SWK14]